MMTKKNGIIREFKPRPNFLVRVVSTSFVPTLFIYGFLQSSWSEAFAPQSLNLLWKKAGFNTYKTYDEQVIRPDLIAEKDEIGVSWYDSLSGAIRLREFDMPVSLPSINQNSSLTETVLKVKEYLHSNFQICGVKPSNLRLKSESTIFNSKHQFLKFDVLKNGTILQDANIDVRLVNWQIKQIVCESFSEATVKKENHTINESSLLAARVISANFTPLQKTYRVKPSTAGYELIPSVKLQGSSLGNETFTVEVNLDSGEMTEISSDKFHLNIPVMIRGFSRNSKEAVEDSPYIYGKLLEEKDSAAIKTDNNSYIQDGDYIFEGLEGSVGAIQSADEKYRLKAKALKIRNSAGQEVFTLPTYGNQMSLANDVYMSFATVYSALSKIKNIVNDTNKGLSPWVMNPSKAYVNEDNECNAYYIRKDSGDKRAGSLNFLQGLEKCNNSGNMADVIAHEWGHGLDDNTGGIEDRAFSEGFGDIVAYVVYFKPDIGIDLKRDGKPIRNISEFRRYPEDRGEFHKEGQIISNTFYDLHMQLRSALPANEADSLIRTYTFNMIKNARKYTDIHDFLMVFETRKDIRCIVNSTFAAHGLGRSREECGTR